MLNVVDKPQIQYVVEECVASGIEHIIIVTGRGKSAIEDHFDFSPELGTIFWKRRARMKNWRSFAISAIWCRSVIRARKSRWDWVTRCWLPKIWSEMNHSLCCSVMF